MDSQLIAFTGIAFVLTITPGVDTMLVLRSVFARGQKSGLMTSFGICCGVFIHATLSAIGISVILVQSAAAFEIVKLIGAAYLVLLGIQSLRNVILHRSCATAADTANPAQKRNPNKRRAYLEGLLTNLLNPKVAVFYLAFLPQFISPGDPVLLKSLLLAGIHFVLAMLWFSFIIFMIGKIKLLLTSPLIQQKMEAITGVILIAFGVRLAFERT